MASSNQSSDQKKDARKEHNRDLIRRMRNGDSLTSYDSTASWFPPRPCIEKDEKEMVRLYGNAALKSESSQIPVEKEKTSISYLRVVKSR